MDTSDHPCLPAPLPAHLKQLVGDFRSPSPLVFGKTMAPLMAEARYENGAWSNLEICAYHDLSVAPNCLALHYGQLIFEGMKAYKDPAGQPLLFRPECHYERFNTSAARMAMPKVPVSIFMGALTSLVAHLSALIPDGPGESLYLRPLMLATESGLGLKPATSFLFLVMASPAGAYFSEKEVRALIERHDSRAAPGGTGAYKVAGNYGASLRSSQKAQHLGYNQTLWLDSQQRRFVEEFSGMNFFAVINDELYTPPLNDSILPGVTRLSLLSLAQLQNCKTHELPLSIDTLIGAIKDGTCSELFACGTAAVITSVKALGEEDGDLYPLHYNSFPRTQALREELTAMQTGHMKAPAGWNYPVLQR